MKPRIVKSFGLWYCGTPGGCVAIGYGPAHAYAEWLAMRRHYREGER